MPSSRVLFSIRHSRSASRTERNRRDAVTEDCRIICTLSERDERASTTSVVLSASDRRETEAVVLGASAVRSARAVSICGKISSIVSRGNGGASGLSSIAVSCCFNC
jgi:hypothetical protein